MGLNRKSIIWMLTVLFVFASLANVSVVRAEDETGAAISAETVAGSTDGQVTNNEITPDEGTGSEDSTVTSVENFVRRLYVVALNRDAEQEGLDFWARGLKDQKYTAAQAVNYVLLESAEFLEKGLSDAEFIDVSYLTFFNRAADDGGRNYWVGKLDEGYSKRWVIANMLSAPTAEFDALCKEAGILTGKIGIKQSDYPSSEFKTAIIVKRLYTVALAREAEIDGLNYWTKGLVNGRYTAAQVVNYILLESPEFLNKGYSDSEFVNISYLTFFNREADSQGRDYWVGRLKAGYTRRWVMANMLNAPTAEFAKLCTAAGIKTGVLGIKASDLPNTVGNTAANISNTGFAAIQGDWIYYSLLNADEVTAGEGFAHLYKVRKNGAETTKVTNEGAVSINVIGEWVYYVQNDEPNWIYKVKTDGTERTVVLEEPTSYMTVTKGYIYYVNYTDLCLYRIKHDGSGKVRLTSEINSYYVVNDSNIVYSSYADNSLYQYIEGKGANNRIGNVEAEYFDVSGEWIFYSDSANDYKVYKIRRDGTQKTKLSDIPTMSVTVLGDWLYMNGVVNLYKMRTDGSQLQSIFQNGYDSLTMLYNIVGDNIFLMNSNENMDYFEMMKLKLDGSSLMYVQP